MANDSKRTTRSRMTGTQRRAQLLDVSRRLFAEKGFDGTSVEEIAARAEVSKPVVYEHFGGKEGVYAVVVDREIQALTGALTGALEGGGHPKVLVERTALALLGYIEASEDGFRILVRDSPVAQATGTFSSLIGDVATQVEHLLADQFKKQGQDPQDGADLRADARRHGRAHRVSGGSTRAAPARTTSRRTWSTSRGTACPALERRPTAAPRSGVSGISLDVE